MIDETYIPFPYSANTYDEASKEDAFCEIFNPKLEPMDINDEINPDKIYFVNGKTRANNTNLNIINFEDFDEFYKKFIEIYEENEPSNANDNNNYGKPSFYINLSDPKIFSSFEDEKLLNVMNLENNEKDKSAKNKKLEVKIIKNDENIKNKQNDDIIDINKDNTFSKTKNIKKKSYDETYYFPFTPGKGLPNCFNPKQLEENSDNSSVSEKDISYRNNLEEGSVNTEQIANNGNNYYEFKFKTKQYYVMPNGKKRRVKRKRKFKSDDIRKKIKSRFHKTLKNIVNDMLKKGGSKKLFDFLPQCFLGNISKKINTKCFGLTFSEMLATNFITECCKDKSNDNNVDLRKFLKNKEVLEYLEENPDISKNSGFDLIKDKKYKDLLKIYFQSAEFENSIIRLKNENESNEYIQEYIFRAKRYVDFYCVKYDNDNDSDEEKEYE